MNKFQTLLKEIEELHASEVSLLKDDVSRLQTALAGDHETMQQGTVTMNTTENGIGESMKPRIRLKKQDTQHSLVSHHSLHSSGWDPVASLQAGTVLERFFHGQGSSVDEVVETSSTKSNITLTLDFVNRSEPGTPAARKSKYQERLMSFGLPSTLENCLVWFWHLEEPPRDGCLFKITSSTWFNATCMWAIFLNAAVLIYAAERDIQDAFKGSDIIQSRHPLDRQDWVFIIELIFTCLAIVEMSMKLIVHRFYFFVNEDWKMNTLDFIVVILSALYYTTRKAANLMHVRMSKAAKSARFLRLLRSFRYFRQLNLLVQCTVGALSSAFWCLMFLCAIVTAFALVFLQAVAAHVEAYPEDKEEAVRRFKGVFFTMLRLFQSVSDGQDWAMLYDDMSMIGPSCQALLVIYVAFCSLVMWNIISAFFIERALAFSLPDIDTALTHRQLSDERDIVDLTNLFKCTKGLDSKTPKHNFVERMQSPEVQEFFSVRDINVTDADLFFTMLHASIPAEYASDESDEDKDPRIDTSILVAACLHMRGAASNFDLQALHWDIRRMHAEIHESLLGSGTPPHGVVAVAAETLAMQAEMHESSISSGRSPRGVAVATDPHRRAPKMNGPVLLQPPSSKRVSLLGSSDSFEASKNIPTCL